MEFIEYYKAIKDKTPDVPGCPSETANKIGSNRERGLRAHENRQLAGEEYWPWRICNVPLQGRSLFGPRFNPMETSLLSILKVSIVKGLLDYLHFIRKLVYI